MGPVGIDWKLLDELAGALRRGEGPRQVPRRDCSGDVLLHIYGVWLFHVPG